MFTLALCHNKIRPTHKTKAPDRSQGRFKFKEKNNAIWFYSAHWIEPLINHSKPMNIRAIEE
jgi:hypothetical protein